jgi:hypothetical protein
MIIKYNRTNTNFQIAYFIAGSCHTPDAAYIALLALRTERAQALAAVQVTLLRRQAVQLRAERQLESADPADQLEGQAQLLEIAHSQEQEQQLIAAAESELAFIDLCIERVQPLRLYAHMSDADAAEACQQAEWLAELQRRAENYLMTQGTIPADQFDAMRQHPDFASVLLPHIEHIHSNLDNPGQTQIMLTTRTGFNLPGMLGLS